jgi:hypothetical protein
MGTTSNYSWPYPESTDPVADGATDIQALADAADTTGRAIQLATIQRFADSTARDTALSGIEVEGMFAFLQDTDVLTYWDGSAWQEFSTGPDVFAVEYLVVGGGGGCSLGAGGAGGMLTGTAYLELGGVTLTVGAGGAGSFSSSVSGASGGDSRFANLISVGGGGGGNGSSGYPLKGGSGGARYRAISAGQIGYGIDGQGNDGGVGDHGGYNSGGGGGAGAVGQDSPSATVAGNGGVGLVSTIISDTQATSWSVGEVSGSDVYYAGGGGGYENDTATAGTGGLGGGGNGAVATTGTNGTANTGGGGGGRYGNGGSGVVILKWLTADASISVGAGLTSVNTTVGDYTVYAFTAGTDTVTFS